MKSKTIAALLSVLLFAAVTGCSALKARLDHGTVQKEPRYDDKGKFTNDPVASVPLWSSSGIKEKPVDVTPPKK